MTDLWNIPQIWSDQIWLNSFKKPDVKPDVAMFDNAPNDVSLWSFFGKIFIWICVWICVSALLFWALTIWWITGNSSNDSLNPLLWVLLPVIWFVACFVWNLALAWLLNIFFSKRYYNFSKMFWLIFAASLITLPLFIIISVLSSSTANSEVNYLILKLQIIFSLFISLNLIDFLSQPNYSASSLIWNSLWCALAIILWLLIKWNWWDDALFVIISVIAIYASMLIWAWIWDAIYYKFYEWGNNPFYLPSLNELREERKKEEIKKKKDEEEINVEMK